MATLLWNVYMFKDNLFLQYFDSMLHAFLSIYSLLPYWLSIKLCNSLHENFLARFIPTGLQFTCYYKILFLKLHFKMFAAKLCIINKFKSLIFNNWVIKNSLGLSINLKYKQNCFFLFSLSVYSDVWACCLVGTIQNRTSLCLVHF